MLNRTTIGCVVVMTLATMAARTAATGSTQTLPPRAMPPTEQTPTIERSVTRCGGSVASRYTWCGRVFTPDAAVGSRVGLPAFTARRRRCAMQHRQLNRSDGFSGGFVRSSPAATAWLRDSVSKCCRILNGLDCMDRMARPVLRATYRTPKDDHP